jgi:hypothetical protein
VTNCAGRAGGGCGVIDTNRGSAGDIAAAVARRQRWLKRAQKDLDAKLNPGNRNPLEEAP